MGYEAINKQKQAVDWARAHHRNAADAQMLLVRLERSQAIYIRHLVWLLHEQCRQQDRLLPVAPDKRASGRSLETDRIVQGSTVVGER